MTSILISTIYNEDFFFNKIIEAKKETVIEVIKYKNDFYTTFEVAKKSGKRIISCIAEDSLLYRIQRNLTNNFFNNIPIATSVYGFVKGYSYKDFLEPHINKKQSKKYYLRVDIKNFFDSIDSEIIREILEYYFNLENDKENEDLLNLVIDIITLGDTLPQGAVTSPVLSNIVFRPLDLRIQKYCEKLNVTYSRYADDMLFSSYDRRIFDNFFLGMICNILKTKGFLINYLKLKRGTTQISLNGFVVGKNLRISRSKLYDISKILFLFDKGGKPTNIKEYLMRLNSTEFHFRKEMEDGYFKNKNQLVNYLCGYRSFLISWLPQRDEKYTYEKTKRLINRIENLVDQIEILE
ncbi:reverse transcriptase family protein [Brassicibacter mesophilus]|uniref:reverse transcriptase family protein n=1 Tax=Brassicibacter mesophilus TaxID=745119 RepID=UPI003D1B8440